MVEEIKNLLAENGNREQAEKMSAYMKNQFDFAGVPKPLLKELIKPFLAETAKTPLDWSLVFGLWELPYREAQYVALEYLQKHRKQFESNDLDNLKKLITEKSWWETVDTIDAFVGDLVLKDESLKSIMLEWAKSDNIWLRRVAIDYQQEYKNKTDTEMLAEIIVANLNDGEFFINKAIGWSLRDYSKVNPVWVRAFIEEHRGDLAPLSVKEAEKYLL